jgi:hypothetical protein
MKTQTTTTTGKTIVAFHIGRGGHFHNGGHKSYVGEKSINEFIGNLFVNYENFYNVLEEIGDRENLSELLEEANGDLDLKNEAYKKLLSLGLDLGEPYWFDSNGNHIISDEDVEIGIGTIDIDRDYDTTYTQYLEDCDNKELSLIYTHYLGEGLILDYLGDRFGEVISILHEFECLNECFHDDVDYSLEEFGIEEVTEEDYLNDEDDNVKKINGKYYTSN